MSGNNNEQSDFKQIAESNFVKITSAISKFGYTEGITAGRDSVFQNGFDLGYEDGLKTGFSIAKFKTLSNVLSLNINDDLNSELNKIKIKNIPDAKQQIHFKMTDSALKSIEEISAIQNKYTYDLMNELQNEFPYVNGLLC